MIYRIDVSSAPASRAGNAAVDPLGEALRQQIHEFGTDVGPITTTRIFLIDAPATPEAVAQVASQLLADPIVESAQLVQPGPDRAGVSRIEVHLKPGVMDPVAESTEMAIRDMGIEVREVRTGRAYVIDGTVSRQQLESIAYKVLANGVVEAVHFERFVPEQFPAGHAYTFKLRTAPIRDLTDPQLIKLSREGHLFLSLDEMKAIQAYFRDQNREPTDAELETLAQTWSEHCVHKTLKSPVELEIRDQAGHVLERRSYTNLIKETIFKSTMQLIASRPGDAFCLSVFADNAGVIAFDQTDAVCFKVETHNRPSAIDPYGGSATGAGGCIRDVLGTGLAARPIANTDIFCVAYPDHWQAGVSDARKPLPRGILHPKRILQQVVAGVRDYGNRMGIPTVNGAVYFDDRYVGNPLVFCGCVGLIPRDRIAKQSRAGDAIVVMGGRTGRDGIHGATFSSAELTDKHADEFAHAVQIGNAITQKKMADVILRAAELRLFSAITDCGAGGLSSAVGEMGEKLGALVHLDRVPLKYAGLRYDEIWISEAQERMVLSVPPEHVKALLDLAAGEDVEATVIGTFGTEKSQLILQYQGHQVGQMAMDFVHKGIPMPTRKAIHVRPTGPAPSSISAANPKSTTPASLSDRLTAALSHPNVASKHWIVRQYDHEVQGGSAIKPFVGPLQLGPSDASVIRPKLSSDRGVALSCGLAPHILDPYDMAVAAIDEAIRNVVAVGAPPSRIAILDNFCWPGTHDEVSMGNLVRTCEACYDAAMTYGVPFISGKDSLHNQFTNQETGEVIRVPNTLLVSAIAVLDDVRRCVTMDLKGRDTAVLLLGPADKTLAHYAKVHHAVAGLIAAGHVLSCHDVSDGGYLTAAAEMCIASDLGLAIQAEPDPAAYFDESPAQYLVEIDLQGQDAVLAAAKSAGATARTIGKTTGLPIFTIERPAANRSTAYDLHVAVEDLRTAWRGTLDW